MMQIASGLPDRQTARVLIFLWIDMMKRAFLNLSTALLLIGGYGNVAAIDAEAEGLIEACRNEAESKGVDDVPDYINTCLDEIMQYDTSSE